MSSKRIKIFSVFLEEGINPTKVGSQEKMDGAMDMIPLVMPRLQMPLRDNLLWGIPNEITLKYIAATLPFSAWKKSATLSADWERAFQGGLVHDARVLFQKTQEFLLFSCAFAHSPSDDEDLTISKTTLSLFSPSEWEWFKFPLIPGCHEGIFHNYQYALLDSSIYLLGGTRTRKRYDYPNVEVLVLDLARHPLEWRRCANMRVPRHDFKVRVMQGKIFAFGGVGSSGEDEVRNEVYQPGVDAWSFIAPTTPLASVNRAFPVGQQFFACIGRAPPNDGPLDWLLSDEDVDTKFVIKIGENGPKMRKTNDVDADDDMDGLHGIIEDKFTFDIPPFKRSGISPTDRVASRRGGRFRGFYYPANDEWRDFDMEILKTYKVDEYRPVRKYTLRVEHDETSESDTDGSGADDSEPFDEVCAKVWSMRF